MNTEQINMVENGPRIIGVMRLPNDPEIKFLHKLYKPSIETTKLKSERGRTLYCEEFIEDGKLGPLSDLCAQTLANNYFANESMPFIEDDTQKNALYFESINVDLPLEQSCNIVDDRYWRRVVNAKSKETDLSEGETWKNRGISLRFVEFLEQHSVEYFVEEDVVKLTKKIKDFVTDLHITNLKSLSNRSFEQKVISSDEESSDWDDDDESSSMSFVHQIASDRSSPSNNSPTKSEEEFEIMGLDGEEEEDGESAHKKTPEEIELERIEEEFEQVKEVRLDAINKALLEEEKERRERHQHRRQKRKMAALVPPVKKKLKIKSVFDIPISEDEDDDAEIKDRRNLEKYIQFKKKYKYPPQDCHHISFRFVRFLDCLVSFTLEFQAKNLENEYHTRFLNFSYLDTENLAYGLGFIHSLKVFRLINSRMDARKLEILAEALRGLRSLEYVDFSHDQLEDDCCYGLFLLFRGTNSIKSLELRGNKLKDESLKKLSIALSHYDGTLDYLGLSQNPLGDAGLHSLVDALIKYEQVDSLNLSATQISQSAIKCCIANELLRKHERLKRLDMIALPMEELTALEFIKAVTDNHTILHLDCRGCDLNFEIEYDVVLILKRNRFLFENPYIGDKTKTEEEINAFINQKKNHIFVRALEAIEDRYKCLKQRPNEFACISDLDMISMNEPRLSYQSMLAVSRNIRSKLAFVDQPTVLDSNESIDNAEFLPFNYDTSKFDEDEFFDHLQQPGPNNRFMYFFTKKHSQEVIDEEEELLTTMLLE